MSIFNKIFPTRERFAVITTNEGNVISVLEFDTLKEASTFIPEELNESEIKRLEVKGSISVQIDEDMVTIKKIETITPPKKVYEARLRHDDPEMEEYHAERHNTRQAREAEKERMAAAPYAVGWDAQSIEWYGGDHPATSKGRYKAKGDGGRIVAINIPTHQQAEQVQRQVDSKAHDGSLDPALNGKHGEDHYILHYIGAWVKSMSELDQYDKIAIKHDQPEDYGQSRQEIK